MNFLPGSDSLLIADSGANTAAVIRNFSTAPASQGRFFMIVSRECLWLVMVGSIDYGVMPQLLFWTPAGRPLSVLQAVFSMWALSGVLKM